MSLTEMLWKVPLWMLLMVFGHARCMSDVECDEFSEDFNALHLLQHGAVMLARNRTAEVSKYILLQGTEEAHVRYKLIASWSWSHVLTISLFLAFGLRSVVLACWRVRSEVEASDVTGAVAHSLIIHEFCCVVCPFLPVFGDFSDKVEAFRLALSQKFVCVSRGCNTVQSTCSSLTAASISGEAVSTLADTDRFVTTAFEASSVGRVGSRRYVVDMNVVLGEGGYSTVFKACDEKTQDLVAVKIMNKLSCKFDASGVQREISILKQLNHQNVAPLKGIYEDIKQFCLVLEYCDGGDLCERLESEKAFSENLSRILMRQVLEAIRYVHQQGVCHRDVKLENFVCLRDSSADKCVLKLIDFGLAVMCAPDDQLTEKAGTPHYVAPEMVNGPHYGQPIDAWACGVIMYAMMSGKLPFGGRQRSQVLRKVKAAKFKFAIAPWDSLTSQARILVCRLLTKTAEERACASDALEDKWFWQPPV